MRRDQLSDGRHWTACTTSEKCFLALAFSHAMQIRHTPELQRAQYGMSHLRGRASGTEALQNASLGRGNRHANTLTCFHCDDHHLH